MSEPAKSLSYWWVGRAALFCLVVLTMASCGGVVDSGLQPHPLHLPNTIGSSWTYSIYSSLHENFDTLTITNVARQVMPGGDTATVALWQFSSDPSTTDTQYVADVDDTMDLYQLFSRQTVFERYVFPLRVGNWWLDMYGNDTSFVAGVDSIEVPASTFTRCFRVDRDWPGYRGNLWLRKWIDPDVGLVKWNEIKYDLGPFGPFARDSAQLIRYTITPPNRL